MSAALEIWSFPKGGEVPDLADLLQAQSVAELSEVSEQSQEAAVRAVEDARDKAIEDARAVAADLKAKGVNFDVDRILRPSLWERVQDKWDELLDWWQRDEAPVSTREQESVPFAFDLPLAYTHPPRSLSIERDVIDAEVTRFTDALIRQITAQRGRGPVRLSVPDDIYDELAEADEWSDAATVAFEADCAVAYWPSQGQPALLLSVVSEDPEHVIEVKLIAHGGPAHRRFIAELEALGGSVD